MLLYQHMLMHDLLVLIFLKGFIIHSLFAFQIQSQKSAFESTCKPIMSKPKPKVEPPPPAAAAPSGGQESDKSKADSSKEGADVDMKEGQVNGGSDSSKDTPAPKDTTMEVD